MKRSTILGLLVVAAACSEDLDPAGVTDSGSLVVRSNIDGWALPGTVFQLEGPTGLMTLVADEDGEVVADRIVPGTYVVRVSSIDGDARLDVPSLTIQVRSESSDTALVTGYFDPGRFAQVTVGNAFICGLNEAGNAYCWGLGEAGELGIGTTGRSAKPLRTRAPEPLTTISAGSLHTCGVGVSGTAYCWGLNASGRLGTGLTSEDARYLVVPTAVTGGLRFSTVVAGQSFACGLEAASGRAWCWGSAFQGQLGNGERSGSSPVPVAVDTEARFVALSANEGWAGKSSVAARTADGRVFVWGASPSSGSSWLAYSGPRPVEVPLPGPARAATTVCALLEAGVVCWPDLSGNVPAEVLDVLLPTAVAGLRSYTTAALDAVFFDGGLHCRPGGGGYDCTQAWAFALPHLDFGGESAVHVSSFGNGGCVVTTEGRIWCWNGDFFQTWLAAGPGSPYDPNVS